jgi:hypothetical protein
VGATQRRAGGVGEWYGRDDVWPEHGEKWWREALPQARDAGWWLDKFVGNSAHRWGKLKCRRTDDNDAGFCVVRIDSSGEGAENVARDVPKKIRNCPHRSPKVEDPATALIAAREQIAGASRILDAVERLIEGSAELARVHDLLDHAFEKAIDEAERYIEEAEKLEVDASAELDEAREALTAGGCRPRPRQACRLQRTNGTRRAGFGRYAQ